MKLSVYQVDAFTKSLFGGNPAAVIPLKKWLPDPLLQQIALENNLSETAFIVKAAGKNADFDIRWFTPTLEINLCGHATLASAWVIFNLLKRKKRKIVFSSQSGLLTVKKTKKIILLDFPSWRPERMNDYPAQLGATIGNPELVGVYKHRDWLVELMDEDAVKAVQPDFTLMNKIGVDKIIVTAPGKDCDFVSRFFAPGAGVNEDPVTGSAHSQLIPFWSEKLGKKEMTARQLSARGGFLWCEQRSTERVSMGGNCVFYMKGTICLP